MAKLIDTFRAAAVPRPPTEEEIDLQNFADNAVKLADHLMYHIVALSLLAKKRGMSWFAAQLGSDSAAQMQSLLVAVQSLWVGGSDAPFPDFPADPVPEDPPPAPQDDTIVPGGSDGV